MQVLLAEQNLPPTLPHAVGDKLKIVDEIQSLLEAANVGSNSLASDGNKENVEELKSDNKTRNATKLDDDNNNSDKSNLNVSDNTVAR